MDLVSLTEEIVKSLVIHKEGVSVKEFPTEDEKVILIQVMVNSDDIGRVIGKLEKKEEQLMLFVL